MGQASRRHTRPGRFGREKRKMGGGTGWVVGGRGNAKVAASFRVGDAHVTSVSGDVISKGLKSL
jgi:hypothetical protein